MLVFTISLQAQDLNLSFENDRDGAPVGWNVMSAKGTLTSFDQQIKQHGKQSFMISGDDKEGFQGLNMKLPKNYEGKNIKLSGYIKTENVQDGFAGLWVRIDPSIAFDNMQNRGVQGTTDWKKYEISLTMQPAKTSDIFIGVLLVGKGKMWVDNLEITIDGKDISRASEYLKPLSKADLDKEFENSSKISGLGTDPQNLQNLKTLGLIWGYLKYYHPKAHSGDLNWDFELFRILPKVNGKNNKERDRILSEWISGLGSFEVAKSVASGKEAKLQPDLKWITDSGLSKPLSDQLLKIKNAKRAGTNYYIDFAPGVGNPVFKNENSYKEMAFPDEGYRLLSLFRYWNMIQYYFPYRNLIEEDWKNVLAEFIPKFLSAKNQKEYTLKTLELIARIHDTHANIYGSNEVISQYRGTNFIPAKVTFIENQAVVSGFLDKETGKQSGLEIGDILTKIDGKPVSEIITERLPLTPASNYPTQLRNIANILLRTNDDSILVNVSRNGIDKELKLKTFNRNDAAFESPAQPDFFKMLDGNIAYFNLGSVTVDKLTESVKKIQNTKGLIIDIRNYPSEFVVFKLGSLLHEKDTEFVKFTQTSTSFPGEFIFTPTLKVPGTGKNSYKNKIAILVNETTQSQAEYTAMAFRASPGAKVFGSTTAGADGNVSGITLPGGIETLISGIGVYYPDGTETQRVGIVPDVVVKPTVDGIKNGKDEVLEKAVEWIRQ